ncbi:MAG: hypothetical protein DRH20_10105, partial [Deltaproteobacteria bacterium]
EAVGSVSVSALSDVSAHAETYALSGGIGATASNFAFVDITPEVQSFVGPGSRVRVAGGITISATARPKAEAETFGVSAGGAAVGVSLSRARVSPDTAAYVAGSITADRLTVTAAQAVPTTGYSARAYASGSVGGLVGINATETTAENTGTVTGYVADNTILAIYGSIAVNAYGDSSQWAEGDSNAYGLIAAGANVVNVVSNLTTRAYLGNNVTIGSGTPVGGLTDGDIYYVVVDKTRTFDPTDVGSNSWIDLGTDHLLQTGDRVVYRATGAGTDPVSGWLTNTRTYTVEVDPQNPNLVRLWTGDVGTSSYPVLTPGSAVGSDFRLEIVNPTRVKLAGSLENAVAETPVTLDLSDPVVMAADHSLTPYRNSTVPARTFDPLTDLDEATNTIYVGRGHGLVTGMPVTYRKSAGPTLSITAGGDDTNFARAEAGSGGLIAGSAAEANVDADSTTRAYIADAALAADRAEIEVSSLTVRAHHTARFDSQTNTLMAAVFGGSGSWAENDIDATVEAKVGDYALVTTENLFVEAVNTSRKDLVGTLHAGGLLDSDYNVESGSGGVITGNSAKSETDIANITYATVGNYADITVAGDPSHPGDFRLRAYNDVEGEDDVRLDAGGAIVGAGAVSSIRAERNDAVATIGDSAHVITVGDVDLETLTRGVLKVEPQVHTYGLAAAAAVHATASIHNHNEVHVGDNAFVEARGDVNLLAGRDRDGTRNVFDITSHGDELNASVIPIDDLTAHGEIVQDHLVVVDPGAQVRSARDANLHAERQGAAIIYAYGSGKNWMTALAGAIDSLFGSDGISEEEMSGSSLNDLDAEVRVEGSVEVGIYKDQTLIIPENYLQTGTVSTQSPGISFTFSTESLAVNLVAEWEHWTQLYVEYTGDPVAQAAYLAEISRVEQQMQALGLYDDEHDLYQTNYMAPYITVDDIWAQSGTITVTGLEMSGTGELHAPGDVEVIITNHSPANLRTSNITIPVNAGGVVRFNYVDVDTNADIGAINESGLNPSFSDIEVAADSAEPRITITNTFDADDPHPYGDAIKTPNIEIAGDIENILGRVEITSEGSVFVRGNINAGTLVITAGGDFVLSYTDSLFHAGGNPGTLWNSVAQVTEPIGSGLGTTYTYSTDGIEEGGNDTTIEQAVQSALLTPSESNIVAANNVFISAQYLNINGTIQSGLPDRWATVTTDVWDEIVAAGKAYNSYRAGDYAGAVARLSVGDWAGVADKEEITDLSRFEYFKLPTQGNIDVFYNAPEDRLELESVRVEGGHMELFGEILSTGNGKLNVLDGYGRIVVDNQTDYDLVTRVLDTGQGVAGVLKITDTRDKDAGGRPKVTEYYRQSGVVWKKTYYLPNPGASPDILSDAPDPDGLAREAVYDTLPGKRYQWQTGQNFTIKETTTYGSSAWLGIDALAADPDNITEGPYRENLNNVPLLEGEYMDDSGVASDYAYTYRKIYAEVREIQRLVRQQGSGTFTLTFDDGSGPATTAALALDVSAEDMESALNGLGTISNVGGVTVTHEGEDVWEIRFNEIGNKNQITASTVSGDVVMLASTVVGGDEGRQRIERTPWQESTWYGKTTYYVRETWLEGFKDIHTHSIRADRPIDIEFIGYDAGDPQVVVDVTSGGDIRVNGAVRNETGRTSFDAAGEIALLNTDAVIAGTSIDLTATAGIGDRLALVTNLTEGQGGALSAVTTSGNVQVRELDGALMVDQVATTTGDVVLTSQKDILGQGPTNLVAGKKITLTAEYGDIGTLGSGGTAATPGAGAQALNLDSGTEDRDTLWARAAGDIFVREQAGDLRLESVESLGGDVRVEVAAGDLEDGNTFEVRDTRTEAQLLALWD